ncbi:MAG: sodium:calcium antiporter [Candidatus Peribacteraceae bacterium]|nr:sodium:calcium antiporter [Candidatus Peribacteraceae bacterium]
MLAFVSLVGGIFLLVKGADWLVDGASSLARRFGVSELAIGLTIVAFGTSTPELAVNIQSSITGANDIAIGNVVGSNIANILLILGIAGVLATMRIQTSTVWKEIPFAVLAALVLIIMANDAFIEGAAASGLTRTDGLTLLAFFFIFLWYTFGMKAAEEGGHAAAGHGLWMSALLVIAGLAGLVLGGSFTVSGAVRIAEAAGVSQALIGFTVVAVGTSLPELFTSAVAAYRGKSDIAIGNIVGSNIFNTFLILGIGATLRPIPFRGDLNVDLLVSLGAAVLLFYLVHNGPVHRRLRFWSQRAGHAIRRIDGIAMLVAYAAYVGFLVWRG